MKSKKLNSHNRLLSAILFSIIGHALIIVTFQDTFKLKEITSPKFKGSSSITVTVIHAPQKPAVSFESVDKWLTEKIPEITKELPIDKPQPSEKEDPSKLADDPVGNPKETIKDPREIIDPTKTSSLVTTIAKEKEVGLVPIEALPPDLDTRQKIEESKTTLGLKVLVNSEGIPLVVKIESGTSDPLQDYILAEAAKKIVWKNLDPPLKEGETRWIDYNITYATEDPLLNAESEAVNQK